MKSTIRILEQNVANQIAAGEVVERPASIIKELVENSLDAGATQITIEIADGGTSFIRVVDDGSGMSEVDAKLSVIRHATSKITSAEDLQKISTLGFRGEALPSIAAVSKFTLLTRLHDSSFGTKVELHGGEIILVSECGCSVGTSITVTDLFYNTPARRKFLKTASAEASQIHSFTVKLALSRPDISFRLINNDKLVLSTPGGASIEDVLGCVYGHQILGELLTLPKAGGDILVTGCIGKPSLLKSSRQWQTFVINGRVISNRMLAKAVENAFHSLLPHSGFPLAMLTISLPPEDVDVNIHPQKSEVKFRDERSVYSAVYRAVSQALANAKQPQEIAAASIPFSRQSVAPVVETSQFVLPFKADYRDQQSILAIRETLATSSVCQSNDSEILTPPIIVKEQSENTVLQALGQVDSCYIIARGVDGLYIVDQHAAHERILYDKMQHSYGSTHSQKLLMPILLSLDPLECKALAEAEEVLQGVGFLIESIGPNTYRLTEMPADVTLQQAEELIKEALRMINDLRDPSPAALRHAYLQTAACKAAVKSGDILNIRQMQAILDELCSTERPFSCPHGRPAMIRFGGEDLARMFKRT